MKPKRPITRFVTRFVVIVALLFQLAVVLSAQVDPRTALLERAGWDAVAAGQAHAAAEAFRCSAGSSLFTKRCQAP